LPCASDDLKMTNVKKFYSFYDGQKTVTLCKNTSDKGFIEIFQHFFHIFVDKKKLDSLNAENSGLADIQHVINMLCDYVYFMLINQGFSVSSFQQFFHIFRTGSSSPSYSA
jgi:hypothetical protein